MMKIEKLINKISFLLVSAVLLSSVLAMPLKAMEEGEVHTPLVKYSKPSNEEFNPTDALTPVESSRCMKKMVRCWTKERTTTRIIHNIYTESTRAIQCVWNFLWCRGCKNNRRLEKEQKDI